MSHARFLSFLSTWLYNNLHGFTIGSAIKTKMLIFMCVTQISTTETAENQRGSKLLLTFAIKMLTTFQVGSLIIISPFERGGHSISTIISFLVLERIHPSSENNHKVGKTSYAFKWHRNSTKERLRLEIFADVHFGVDVNSWGFIKYLLCYLEGKRSWRGN